MDGCGDTRFSTPHPQSAPSVSLPETKMGSRRLWDHVHIKSTQRRGSGSLKNYPFLRTISAETLRELRIKESRGSKNPKIMRASYVNGPFRPCDIDCQGGGGGMRYVSLINGEERERPTSERRRPFKINKVHPKVYRMGRAEMHAGARVHMPANESPPFPVSWPPEEKRFV